MSFFNELKRRNVFRVGAAYLVVAWLLVQVVDTLGDLFALPDAFGRGVVILLALGFPIALVISWIYEMTPEGVTTQDKVDAGAKATSGHKLNAVIIGGLVLALLLVVLDAYVLEDSSTPATGEVARDEQPAADTEITQSAYPDDKTIAVLPFDNLSPDPDQEYFADGLSEELINKLSQIRELQVTGRNSSFYFKGKDETIEDIAEFLGVNYVLQGSVRKSAEQLRITAQLLNADTGFNLWSQTFDREYIDIFEIQDEISDAVATALSITLGTGDFGRPGNTNDVEAYDEFLKGLAEVRLFSPDSVVKAVMHFDNAVAIDPDFALAWSAMANLLQFEYGDLVNEEYRQKLLKANEMSNRLLPDLLETQINNAQEAQRAGEWATAESIYLANMPQYGNSSSQLNLVYGRFLYTTGRLKEALPYLLKAKRLEPIGSRIWLGKVLAMQSRFAEAIEVYDEGINLGIGASGTSADKSFVQIFQNDWESARASSNNFFLWREEQLVLLDYAESGNFEGGLAYLHEILNLDSTELIIRNAVIFALVFGDPEYAMEIQRQIGIALGDYWYGIFSPMRQLQKFKNWLDDVGLADYWRSTGNWPDLCRPLDGSDDFECF